MLNKYTAYGYLLAFSRKIDFKIHYRNHRNGKKKYMTAIKINLLEFKKK